MAKLIFNIHIPLLRITKASFPLMGGTLWQLSFETFNGLTAGAFSDHQAAYEKTAPVFFNFELETELGWIVDQPATVNGVIESKLPTNENSFSTADFPLFNFFKIIHEHYVDPLWEVLLLAAPTAHIVQPRHSITFITLDDPEKSFLIGESLSPILSFRGDTDLEYVFKPDASGKPVNIESFYSLPDIGGLLSVIRENPLLKEALESFKLANLPYLNRTEQLMITIAALESLMLPDIYSGLKRNFSARIARLLAQSPEEYERLNKVCRKLYDYRSKAIHGKDTADLLDMAEESNHYYGAQLLSSCIISLSAKIAAGETMEQLIAQLDDENRKTEAVAVPPLHQKVINSSPYRLLNNRLKRTATFSPGARTATTKDTLTFWCPLIGLNPKQGLNMSSPAAELKLNWMSGRDVISLEDKDIRRDFIAQLYTVEHYTAALEISFPVKEDFHLTEDHPIYPQQIAFRNLLTIGLRLAGFRRFVDPELLGVYAYHGRSRYRHASVLRQSILSKLKKDPLESISIDNIPRLEEAWRVLLNYHYRVAHEDIDHTLSLYRRIHEQEYIPLRSRAKLLFATLESMMGRFRRWEDPVQLEDLIMAVVGEGEATHWFKEKGRKTRNGVAHGNWDSIEGIQWFDHSLAVIDALIPIYLECWLNLVDRGNQRPGRAFVRYAESRMDMEG